MPKKRKRRPATVPRRPAGVSPSSTDRRPAALGSDLLAGARPAPAPAKPVSPAGGDRAADAAPLLAEAVPLDVTPLACGPVEGQDPQALGLTYWFDAPAEGAATAVTVRFAGKRLDVGTPGPKDAFTTQAVVDPVLPGSGRTAITTRVVDVTPGEWQVWASASTAGGDGASARLPDAAGRGPTAFAPVVRVRAPGVRLGAWPFMVLLGASLGLAVQAALAVSRDVSALRLFLVTLLACVVGVVGAKIYYLVTHRGESNNLLTVGMSVQGFVIGCIATVVIGSLAAGLRIGTTLDLTAPGLLLGMTVGRIGCFFGGCCAGRPTASRWGLWSSDRRLGTRRIPVQLMESAMAGAVFACSVLVVSLVQLPWDGLAFIGSLAAYIFGRQLLFPLRDLPRKTAHGRQATMVVAATLLLADIAIVLAG